VTIWKAKKAGGCLGSPWLRVLRQIRPGYGTCVPGTSEKEMTEKRNNKKKKKRRRMKEETD